MPKWVGKSSRRFFTGAADGLALGFPEEDLGQESDLSLDTEQAMCCMQAIKHVWVGGQVCQLCAHRGRGGRCALSGHLA